MEVIALVNRTVVKVPADNNWCYQYHSSDVSLSINYNAIVSHSVFFALRWCMLVNSLAPEGRSNYNHLNHCSCFFCVRNFPECSSVELLVLKVRH